nr:Formate dehydrogenase H [Klebsiella pneumoniae]
MLNTNNVDCCARVCHGPSVAGLQQALGNGAMSNSISDIENSKCLLVFGYNCADSHPIVARRVIKAGTTAPKSSSAIRGALKPRALPIVICSSTTAATWRW